MDINYELYKVFYYVADTLSFSEASKRLFISQSAVSQSIVPLEKKLDQVLFIRSTKFSSPRKARSFCAGIRTGDQSDQARGNRCQRHHLPVFSVPYLERFHKAFPNAHIK